jgi:hypothetical protein
MDGAVMPLEDQLELRRIGQRCGDELGIFPPIVHHLIIAR